MIPRIYTRKIFSIISKNRNFKQLLVNYSISPLLTNLGIIPASNNMMPVWWVRHTTHVIEVTLLFEYVALTLPFPHEQLSHTSAAQRDPVTRRVETHCRDILVWDTENIKGKDKSTNCSLVNDKCVIWHSIQILYTSMTSTCNYRINFFGFRVKI